MQLYLKISDFERKHKFVFKNELMLFKNFCKLNNFSANHQTIPLQEIKL